MTLAADRRCEISSNLVDEPRQIVQEFRFSAGLAAQTGTKPEVKKRSSGNVPGTGTKPEA